MDGPDYVWFLGSYLGAGATVLLLPATCLKPPSLQVGIDSTDQGKKQMFLALAQGLTAWDGLGLDWRMDLIGHGRLSACLIIGGNGGSYLAMGHPDNQQ